MIIVIFELSRFVRVIFVMLHLNARYDGRWVRGAVEPVASVGSSHYLHGERRAELACDVSSFERNRSRRPHEFFVEVRCGGVGGDQVLITAAQQGEIEEKRRVTCETPTAQSEQEVAVLSKLESACQRQEEATVDSCVLLEETCGKQRWKRPGKPEHTMHAVGVGLSWRNRTRVSNDRKYLPHRVHQQRKALERRTLSRQPSQQPGTAAGFVLGTSRFFAFAPHSCHVNRETQVMTTPTRTWTTERTAIA